MDDEEIVCDIAKQMLLYLGYEVEVAFDGETAVELYRQQFDKGVSFSVVIMDLNIPDGMGGQEAVKEVLAIDPSAKVVVSSGYSNDPILQAYEKYGFSGAIGKPFDLESLKRSLGVIV